jgi:aspartate/methionine/tyrosine aminotransferase
MKGHSKLQPIVEDDIDLCLQLARTEGIKMMPGSFSGVDPKEMLVRISHAVPMENLEAFADRLTKLVKTHRHDVATGQEQAPLTIAKSGDNLRGAD